MPSADDRTLRAQRRAEQKRRQEQRRADIMKDIAQAKDEVEKKTLQDQLDNMEVDEPDNDDEDKKDVKQEESTDATTSATAETAGASAQASGANSNANSETTGANGSKDNPFPVDEDGDPVLSDSNEMGSQDASLAGLPVETVAVRNMVVAKTKIPKDYINMYGPKSAARWIINSNLRLKEGQSAENLLDVSSEFNRRIDKPVKNPAERVTWTDFHSIVIVAWECGEGLSPSARLEKLDPVVVKKADKYDTKQARQKAIREDGIQLGKYPPTYVKVRWKDNQKSWERASELRSLFSRDPIGIETLIYNKACEQEERHQQWLNKERPGRSVSPTPGPQSTLRNKTPEAEQPSQREAAKATNKPPATIKTEQAAPAADTTAMLESGLKAFIAKYKDTEKIPQSTSLSPEQKMDVLGNWQLVQKELKKLENMAF